MIFRAHGGGNRPFYRHLTVVECGREVCGRRVGEDFGLEAVAGVGQLDARLPEVAAEQTEAENATGVLVERTADVAGV